MGVLPDGAVYIPGFICTLSTCSVKIWGYVKYQPSIPGNAIFLVLIDLMALAQLILGPYHHTGLVCISMLFGLASESTGYVVRLLIHGNPFSRVYFLIQLVCLSIGPVFIAAAVYLSLGRIVVVYGEGISRIKPKSYTLFFMACDAVSLIIQAIGGGIAASYPLTNDKMINLGTHILIAGLAFQVASLFAFSVCSLEFLWRVRKSPELRNPDFIELTSSRRFKLFLGSLGLATTCLFIRCVFRSVELSQGFSGKLANNEVEFMILDGVMVIIASACMTIMHPGYAFGKRWNDASFPFTTPKAVPPTSGEADSQTVAAGSSDGGEKAEPKTTHATVN